jgi:glycerophosphoryl diester phosphodiesterase
MKVLNIAHRGGGALRPENTMAAFRNAVALGADGAELDV